MLAPAASCCFSVLFAQRALNLANLLYPKTFDLSLYVFDGSFGFQPSFLMGIAMASSAMLRLPALLVYTSLPFVMALVYALRIPKGSEKPTWDIVTLFMLAGIGGWALYNLLPASGPAYVFGPNFPWNSLPYSMLDAGWLWIAFLWPPMCLATRFLRCTWRGWCYCSGILKAFRERCASSWHFIWL